MPFTRNEGVKIAYDLSLTTDGDVVAFVEGWGYGQWMWQWQRPALDSYVTTVIDNRGTGDTEAPGLGMPAPLNKLPEKVRQALIYLFHREKYAISKMAADLEATLADLDVDQAHVVGASMGGMIALQHALDYDRTASLTLMCTTAGGDMENLVPDETLAQLENVPDGLDEREQMIYRMEPATTEDWRTANEKTLDRIIDSRLRQDASRPAREAQAMGQLNYDVRDRLDEVDVPVMVMHGTGDRVVPFERGEQLAAGLDCEFDVYEDAPHLFFIEQADAVTSRLQTFIGKVTD